MLLTAFAILSTLSLPAAGQGDSPAERDLRARDRALVMAFLENDAAAIRDLYAPNAIVMPPNAPIVEGHAHVAPWARSISAVLVKFSASPMVVQVEGDLAWIAGRYAMTTKAAGGGSSEDQGKYLEVWRRIDGKWRVVADMFNSDRPGG